MRNCRLKHLVLPRAATTLLVAAAISSCAGTDPAPMLGSGGSNALSSGESGGSGGSDVAGTMSTGGGPAGSTGGTVEPGDVTGGSGGNPSSSGATTGAGGSANEVPDAEPTVVDNGRDAAVGGGGSAATGTGGAPPAYVDGGAMDPGTEGDGDFTFGPTFTAAADSRTNGNTPKGTLHKFTMPSSSSAIYPSDVQSGKAFDRQVQVYIPYGYVSNTEVPFMVAQDGARHQGQLIPVLDNMIASKKLPSMVAILIEPGPGDGTGSERSNEYDKVSDKYSTFMEKEVLPKVQADYKVKLTMNPEGRAAFGGSSGGPAAFGMAWFRPDLYRRVITYSGSFVNLARDSMYPNGAWDYHETLIPNTPLKPIRVALSCGENDNGSTSSESSHRNWKIANQNMAKVLKAKGYHYRFVFGKGSGHDADDLIKQTLPDTMSWLWRGYVPPK